MTELVQDAADRCDLLDVLEEAATLRRPIAVKLKDGTSFIDEVTDVVTENGDDFAVFRNHPKTSVGQIQTTSQAQH